MCRPCKAEWQRNYNAKNAERIRKKVTLRSWGMTEVQYDALVAAQDGRCAVCRRGTVKTLCVDHDHATGQVRGLCCQDCNLGMGQLGDDPDRLERAAAYLRAGGVLAEPFFAHPEAPRARRTETRRRARLPRIEVPEYPVT